jgi:hypothetical protein
LAPIVPEGPKVRQRTNGPAERMAREFRRFLRPREALRSSAMAPALVALAVAKSMPDVTGRTGFPLS